MTASALPTVLLTDYAWPDIDLERSIIEGAGFRLVSGPSAPLPVQQVDALVADCRPAAILTCWAQVSETAIASAPDLKIVARLGVGLDNIAVGAASARGVLVTNVPDYCVEEVSDHVLGLLLAWSRGIVAFDRSVRAGHWDPASARLRRLSTLTCGIIGYGRIGRRTAAKLQGFGVRLLVNARHAQRDPGIEFTDLATLLQESDVVIVHVPLTPETHHLIDAQALASMKRGAMLINVSRGGIVDSDALAAALASGQLGAAGLDVLESEPAVPPALLAQDGAIITPHVAFSSDASLLELRGRACEEVVRVLRGETPHYPCNQPLSR